jgi:hypothetical protein
VVSDSKDGRRTGAAAPSGTQRFDPLPVPVIKRTGRRVPRGHPGTMHEDKHTNYLRKCIQSQRPRKGVELLRL